MKFNSPVRYALAVFALALVTSCGGGGAKNNPDQGGLLTLLPASPTFYAGVQYTMTVSGGRAPYSLTSDQPQVMSVPSTINGNTFTVVPNNPGVIDTGLPPGSLPVRTVNVTARDSAGQGPVTAAVKVGQNFLTSYALDFPTTSCTLASSVTNITPCAGGDTVAQVDAVIAGNKVGDALFQFDIVTGQMAFVNPIGSNTTTQSYQTTSDHQGIATALIRVPSNAPTQIGMIRVTHVVSGASTLYSFLITAALTSPLAATPSTFTFTGVGANCGNGSGDFFVTGGVGPYKAVSSDPNVSVLPIDAAAGRFRVSYFNPSPPCAAGSVVVVTDSANSAPASVTVTSTAGTTTTPTPTAVVITPADFLQLACGQTSTFLVTGGSGNYSVSSTTPLVTVTISGNAGSATLAPAYAAGSIGPSASVLATDGSTAASTLYQAPNACP